MVDYRSFVIQWASQQQREREREREREGEREGALEGTHRTGQTEPKRRYSQIFDDSAISLENKALDSADVNRKLQEPAENRRGAFVPLGLSPSVQPQERERQREREREREREEEQ